MINELIFQHKSQVRCCSFLEEGFVFLASDDKVIIWNICEKKELGTANMMNVINIVKIKENSFLFQSKTGDIHIADIANFKFENVHQHTIPAFGFLKLVPFSFQDYSYFWIISSEQPFNLQLYSSLEGKLKAEFPFEEE